MGKWLLPEHVEDILPPEAERIEALRTRILEVFRVHGYELVMPPMLEYIDSLLTGTGHDLDLRTFKLIDQLSGRTMGIRADMTPQVARIDAHLLNREGIARLCYCGSVIHTRPRALTSTREPLQIGAEIYGHSGVESDVEMQLLLRAALEAVGARGVRLDLGHVGVFRSLARRGNVAGELESELLDALQQKDRSRIGRLANGLSRELRDALDLLPELYGGPEVIERARRELPMDVQIASALDALARLASEHVEVGVDLADLRGYHYHSGVVLAAYCPASAGAIALGGRYDEVGKAFGRARPATGFSMDLRELAALAPAPAKRGRILAPLDADAALKAQVAALRAAGEVVIHELPGHEHVRAELGCDRRLVKRGDAWSLELLVG